ncbi:hypothetical protein SAMN04488005_3096 [Yoonia tamlensis]|uniref:HPt domain-containing protein n=1 Tax=Yoonia tamlensis TaxID=390270 RepID=A0A1I6HXR4_9RHOB|nr:hypothetical protein [Yoonia tamlensis]SFR59199.1 hypothetical protein SAMN04488005_3096 [Yoonia tamlensis]
MENKHPTQTPETDVEVIILRCPDRLQFDAVPLQRLFAAKPANEAEAIICRVLEDLAQRLDVLQNGFNAGNLAMMLKPCRKIRLIAEQIGLTEFAIAADHVQTCLRQADATALAATMARLERAFDVAVAEVWKFRQS